MGNPNEVRILLLNGRVSLGGVERQISYLLHNLSICKTQKKLKVFFISYRKECDLRFPFPEDVTYRHFYWPGSDSRSIIKYIFFPLFLARLFIFCITHKINIVHTWGPLDNLVGSILSSLLHIPQIASVRTINSWALRGSRWWAPRAAYIVSNSCAGRELILTRFPRLGDERVRIIRNGLDLSRFTYQQSLPEGPYTFLCVGRISPVKNQLSLVEAFARFWEEQGGNCRLILCGEIEREKYYQQIISFIERRDLHRWITILPYTSDILPIYRQAHCVVLPSLAEGVPNVILEAMALGIPWIVSNVADAAYLVGEHRERGWLFPDISVEGIYRGLCEVYTAPQHVKEEKRRASRAFVEKEFSIARMAEEFCELYKG